MIKNKLVRITTVPQSLKILLKGQLNFMSHHYEVVGVSSPGSQLNDVEKTEGIQTIPLVMTRTISPIADISALWKLFIILRKEKPLIVHTHTPKAGLLGMLAAKMAGVPIRLHTVAGLPLVEATGLKRKLLNFIEKLTYRFAHKIYPNSKGQYDFILQENFLKKEKLKIIGNGSSNGIDVSYFDPNLYSKNEANQTREKWGMESSDFVFVFIGRIVKDKGINELVQAFTTFCKTHENVKLLIVGKYEQHLNPLNEETIIALNNHPLIITTGYQNDVRPFFYLSNALVFPSYREGFPNVVMQAQSMGLPSIVTNINGCNEIIKQNHNGLIIPIKNSVEIEKAMNTLYINKELYNTCKKNARKSITSRYQRELIWDSLLEEYKQIEKKILN